jgi:DNA polymerase III delta prime subunit
MAHTRTGKKAGGVAERRHVGRYALGRQLVRGDKSGRAPALHEADDGGVFLFAKIWPRMGSAPDARALWNHEVRSLLRIGSYPRAADFFVRIRDLGTDETRHWLVLDAGDRRLLSGLLAERTRFVWLRDLNTAQNRRRMWDGLRRVATGLGILHGEGTLHRSLDASCVFIDQEGHFDLRLSGFEWSLQLSASTAAATGDRGGRMRAPELDRVGGAQSFATDWFDFGMLVAEMLGLPVSGKASRALGTLLTAIDRVSYLTGVEKDLLRRLLAADPELRLARSADVLQALSEAGSAVRNRSIFASKPLYVGAALGPGSKLTEAIVDVCRSTDEPVDPTDREAQLRFIRRDTAGDVQILVRRTPMPHYVIDGRRLQYRVQQWSKRQTTWDVGYCGSTEYPRSDPGEISGRLDGRAVEFRLAPKVLDNLLRVRQMAVDWTAVFPFEDRSELLDNGQRFTLNFFRLTNQLDALLTAARLWPVRVTKVRSGDGRLVMEVTPLPDPDRELLAHNLGLPHPAEQMRVFFADDESDLRFSTDVEFTFSSEGVLGRSEQESNVRWRFSEAQEHPDGWRYRFWHEELETVSAEEGAELYLMPREIAGSVAQLKRRHRAIENMRDHAGLLSALERPGDMRHDVEDDTGNRPSTGVDNRDSAAKLDQSKREALAGIRGTQPLYALQGPPGTGKTHLLDALANEVLVEDPSAQILISAQSHEAVDIVKRKLARRHPEGHPDRPLLIRLDRTEDPFHAGTVAQRYAEILAQSDLARACPDYISRRATAAAALDRKPEHALDAKSFEALIRAAANVVFATSNSGELERMLEDAQRFDWSIVEEAGKAHGFDLALALQASHRMLLIGDQEQLPPFNFEALEGLLAEPVRVRTALTGGGRFAPGLVDRSIVSEDPDTFRADCALWRSMVRLFAELFRRCAESDRGGVTLARRLDTQHRMHPHIAELVSRCFYGGQLHTDQEREQEFLSAQPPFEPADWLGEERIVFLDLPWVQAEKGASGERGGRDGQRRYSNPVEVEAACLALAGLRARQGERCELQVLTPYHAQRRLLVDTIRERVAEGGLQNLRAPEFQLRDSDMGMTVDSFQGGEADVVIASLVRNNDAARGRGTGIVAQSHRLNVMLSRARHKLVVVGSWAFLKNRFESGTAPDPEDPLWHLHLFLAEFSRLETVGRARRIPLDIRGRPTA